MSWDNLFLESIRIAHVTPCCRSTRSEINRAAVSVSERLPEISGCTFWSVFSHININRRVKFPWLASSHREGAKKWKGSVRAFWMHLQRSYNQNNSLGGAGVDGLMYPVHNTQRWNIQDEGQERCQGDLNLKKNKQKKNISSLLGLK